MLPQSAALAHLLGLESNPPEVVRETIADIVNTYFRTCGHGTTIGETLTLLKKVRRLIRPLALGKRLRLRDLEPRLRALKRLTDSEWGTAEHTFDLLSPVATKLVTQLECQIDHLATARELDELAAHEIELLKGLENCRKVERAVEHKRWLCGCLAQVWKRYADPKMRDPKYPHHRRAFIGEILDSVGIAHPRGNHYQAFDDWIKTDVLPPQLQTAPALADLHPRNRKMY